MQIKKNRIQRRDVSGTKPSLPIEQLEPTLRDINEEFKRMYQ